MNLGLAVKKIRRNANDYGFRTAVLKGVRYALRPLFEQITYQVYAIDLQGANFPRRVGSDFMFHTVRPEDAAVIEQIGETEEWLEGVLQDKVRNGGLCIAALDAGRVAGFNLIAFREVYLPLVQLHRQLGVDEAWSEQISVRKEYRKRGLAADIRYATFGELQSRGIARLYGATLTGNTASLRLARRVGFAEVEEIRYRSICGYRTWRHRKTG
jgi:RimJ/RimL family protein N-acetyltransferase